MQVELRERKAVGDQVNVRLGQPGGQNQVAVIQHAGAGSEGRHLLSRSPRQHPPPTDEDRFYPGLRVIKGKDGRVNHNQSSR